MKSKINIILIFLFLIITGYYVFKDSFSKKNSEFLFLDQIEEKAEITKFTIYGRFFNLEGNINQEVDNLILVFKNDDVENEYNLNTEIKNQKTYFQTTTLINEGINLEDIIEDEYIILLKTISNNEKKYYTLTNKTEYSNLEYYTITKNDENKKIMINFAEQDNFSYLYLSCNPTKLPNEYYDIVIDPGHGGIDVGAYKNGYYESKINLDYSLTLKKSLENLGLKVKLTREEDINIPNYGENSRVGISYETKAKLTLAIHQNSSITNVYKGGFEVYVVNNTNIEFAQTLVSNIQKYTSSPISSNTAYKVDSGVYLRTLSKSDLEDIKNEAIKNGYLPYEKATLESTYYYMIREVGGIITNSYVDMKNPEKSNIYYNSNHGVEAYLLEMGYLNSNSNLKIILNEKDNYIKAITESVKEYLNL